MTSPESDHWEEADQLFAEEANEIVEEAEVIDAVDDAELEPVSAAHDVEDVDSEEIEYEDNDESEARRRFLFLQAAPAWLVSTLVHVLILLILGLLTIAESDQNRECLDRQRDQ